MRKKTEKEVRFRMPEGILKEYKLLCIEMDLSIPKQTTALVVDFIKVHKENVRLMREARREQKELEKMKE